MESRLRKRFDKADAKTSKLQTRANKKFNKANAQRNSLFRKGAAEKTFDKGYKITEKRQRQEYRMEKTYEKYLKKFEGMNVKMDKDLKAKGLDYYNRVLANTDAQYKAALNRRVG